VWIAHDGPTGSLDLSCGIRDHGLSLNPLLAWSATLRLPELVSESVNFSSTVILGVIGIDGMVVSRGCDDRSSRALVH
jgi:hypothetical protein